MIAAARMIAVPGKNGATVPINPTAKSRIVISHQNNSIGVCESRSVTRFKISSSHVYDSILHCFSIFFLTGQMSILYWNSASEFQTGGFSMPLAVGTKAPDFTLSTKTADGPKQVKLGDNFGKRN